MKETSERLREDSSEGGASETQGREPLTFNEGGVFTGDR